MSFTLLRQIRKERALTQKELAKLLGVKPSVISRYETGSLTPSAKRLEELSNILNVDFEILFSGLEKPILVECEKHSNPDQMAINIIKTKQKYHVALEKAHNEKVLLLERLVRLAANGKCELCGQPAPFLDQAGLPFLEVCLVDTEPKELLTVRNLIALCPNCSCKIHIRRDPEDLERIKEIALSHNF